MTALLILAPSVPLLFMGEEYGERRPFLFFADFDDDLAHATRQGRRDEAEKFGGLPAGTAARDLPDPGAAATFDRSRLDWSRAASPEGRRQIYFLRELIGLRQAQIVPLLAGGGIVEPHIAPAGNGVLAVDWRFPAATLAIRANLMGEPQAMPPASGDTIFRLAPAEAAGPSILVAVERAGGSGNQRPAHLL
jgi:1,4-alpha-glucan branching enzyme